MTLHLKFNFHSTNIKLNLLKVNWFGSGVKICWEFNSMAQQMLAKIWSFEIILINAWCMSLLNHTCDWKCSHVKPRRIENKVLCPTFSKDYIYQTFAFRIKEIRNKKLYTSHHCPRVLCFTSLTTQRNAAWLQL